MKDDEIPNLITSTENRIHTFGTRGSFNPHEDITLWGESALQLGTFVNNQVQPEPNDRFAYAFDLGGEARLWQEQYAWKPVIGVEYIFYSGEPNHNNTPDVGEDFRGWNRMFRGKVDSAIHEWYNVFYTNGMPTTADNGGTNLHQFIVMGSIEPMDNLKIDGRWIFFRLHENATPDPNLAGGQSGQQQKNVGHEVDIQTTYEYTEDVTFGLLTAWFWAGDYYGVPEETATTDSNLRGASTGTGKDVATEVVASCKVSF